MKYLYYPGCSVKGTAIDFEESFLAVAPLLGIEIHELSSWNCCGATVAKSVDSHLAESLPLKTLQHPNPKGLDLLMLCPSCHLNHQALLRKAEEYPSLLKEFRLSSLFKVKQLLEVLAFDLGPQEIEKRVRKSLRGIRVLPYYGCLVIRPFALGGKESLENPQAMERLIEAMGGQPVPFPDRMDCCGGGLVLTREKTALKLGGAILRAAKKVSPHCLAVTCPLCHFMLDAKQRSIERETGEKMGLPVLYLTQVLGLALGLDPEALGLKRLITSPASLLARLKGKAC